jgi:hypothetical protein
MLDADEFLDQRGKVGGAGLEAGPVEAPRNRFPTSAPPAAGSRDCVPGGTATCGCSGDATSRCLFILKPDCHHVYSSCAMATSKSIGSRAFEVDLRNYSAQMPRRFSPGGGHIRSAATREAVGNFRGDVEQREDAGTGSFAGPNVRAKRATTAGRLARAGENGRRTTGPGLVACRWRSA